MDIAFIGLGRMGAPMAANLLAAGHRLRVHDARRGSAAELLERGAWWAETPGEAAAGAAFAITCLPGPAEVDAVARGPGGLLGSLAGGSAWIDCTTSDPHLIRDIAAAFGDRGVDVLDAPVSGGPAGAQRHALVFWVGGTPDAFARCRPVFDAMADEAMHVGPLGSGLVAKLAHNAANFTVQAVLAEAFTLGVKAGLDPLVLFKALRRGALGRNRPLDRLAEQFLPGRYDPPAMALDLAHKDLALAVGLAREHGLSVPFTQTMLRDMAEAIERGWASRDARIALTLQEERAGISVRIGEDRLKDAMR